MGVIVALALATMCRPPAMAAPDSYTFSVDAGSGGTSSSLDGNGTSASFLGPYSAAIDSAGNLYVADYGNNLIRKITPTGDVTTLAGSTGQVGSADGSGSNARFNGPIGIAVDANGNVYVSDAGNFTIRKISPTGAVTTLAGTAGQYGSSDGTGSAARFWGPRGLAVDSSGNLYATDYLSSTIRKITPDGVVTTFAGSAGQSGSTDGPAATARFNHPAGVAIAPDGSLYVADSANYTIRRIATDGVVTTIAGIAGSKGSSDGMGAAAQFSFPTGIAVNASGMVYVTDNCTLRTIAADGTVTTLAGTPGQSGYVDDTGGAARFGNASSVTIASTGQAYVTDSFNQAIRAVTAVGTVTTFAGGSGSQGDAGGAGNLARFNWPRGLAVGPDGTVYVADTNNKAVRLITPQGVVSNLSASLGPITPARLTVDSSGNVYASDGNCQVFKIAPPNVVSVLAGATSSGNVDGTGTAAKFGDPEGMAIDRDGNLYVADRGNSTIRKITPAGVVSTFAGDPAGPRESIDGLAGTAKFNAPRGVAVDRDGNVYVADTNNCTIRKITPQGWVTTLAGSPGVAGSTDGTGSAARFDNPYDVAVDAHGYVYVADTGNHTIRGISPGGMVTTLGGLAGNTDYATGTDSAAHFALPENLAVSADGLLYVVDSTYNTVLVGSNQSAPAITASPSDRTVLETSPTTFSVSTTGGYVNYQWRKNGSPIAGATDATLTLDQVKPGDAGSYDVVVSNTVGTVTSSAATLTVTPLAVVSNLSSTRQVLSPGDALNLSVTASGTGTLSYQWVHNGNSVAGATTNTYTVASVSRQDAGWYQVLITDDNGTRRSPIMFVTVAPMQTQVRAWGRNDGGLFDVPPTLSGIIALSGGDTFALALKSDGTVAAWGDDSRGQTDVPVGLTDIVAVSAGTYHALALKNDGTVVAWGDDQMFESDVPAGLNNVVAIAAGNYVSLALRSDGSVVAWGDGTPDGPTLPSGLTNVVATSCGTNHTLALKADGTVVAWGYNSQGQTTVPSSLSGVIAISAGGDHSLALKDDGTVVAWGSDAHGESDVPSGLMDVVAIAAGGEHSLALKSDGTVVAWGDNTYGETTLPADLGPVWAIEGTGNASLALHDATGDTAPAIGVQPTGQIVMAGDPASFSVTATGTTPLTYQWQLAGSDIPGATGTTYSITSTTTADAGNYTVVVSNGAGSITSEPGTLTVHPLSQTITFGTLPDRGYTADLITLSATASSGFGVSFTVISGPATVSGNQLTLTGTGTVMVEATQSGDTTYAAATPVDRSFTVTTDMASWDLGYFTAAQLADSSITGPDADPDHDGLTNLMEYALGLDPMAASTTGRPEVAADASNWTYTFTRPSDRPDLIYTVEVSTDLVNWTTTGVTLSQTGTSGSSETWQAAYPTASASTLFFRLKVDQAQ